METASTQVTSIQRRNDIEKSTWKLIEISSILKVESTWKFPRRIDVIISTWIHLSKSMKFRQTVEMSNRWRIDEDVFIGCATFKVKNIESLFYKINTFLQKTTTCIRLQAQQIFSVNI